MCTLLSKLCDPLAVVAFAKTFVRELSCKLSDPLAKYTGLRDEVCLWDISQPILLTTL